MQCQHHIGASVSAHTPLCVFDHHVLSSQLIVVGEVVDQLVLRQANATLRVEDPFGVCDVGPVHAGPDNA